MPVVADDGRAKRVLREFFGLDRVAADEIERSLVGRFTQQLAQSICVRLKRGPLTDLNQFGKGCVRWRDLVERENEIRFIHING